MIKSKNDNIRYSLKINEEDIIKELNKGNEVSLEFSSRGLKIKTMKVKTIK
ncbi:hypothetical protein [Clostridium estertheticum]|uniref:hypothetical protein n=1 Tax=Clostridium estertheticum TaxID=238834 RepID=UPI00129CC2A1|nr:hypothetical protein [Clostridium estertheticum]